MNVKVTNQSPFHELSSPIRKERKEIKDFLKRVFEDMVDGLHTKDDNT